MTPLVGRCGYRTPLETEEGSDRAHCGVVAQILGVAEGPACVVNRDACEACLQSLVPGDALNPVVASLIFMATDSIRRAGGIPGCSVAKAEALRGRVEGHLAVVLPGLPERVFPPRSVPGKGTRTVTPAAPGAVAQDPTWMVAVTTAPRSTPTLGPTLRSLERAGFGAVHIFAEPGSEVPPEAYQQHHVHQNAQPLGNFSNFYYALTLLYEENRDADCLAVFQDDIEAAVGLKSWCDRQLWPEGTGIVSLFTPRLHGDRRTGWRLLSPGYHRIFGGQAMLFRRDVVESFLSDPVVLRELRVGRYNSDALVSAWAARRGTAIAYHTPSLVQHVGAVSSIYRAGPEPRIVADALTHVDEIAAWRPPRRRAAKIGLVGWSSPTGLGYQNHDLARHLDVDRWLIPVLPGQRARVQPGLKCRVEYLPHNANPALVASRLSGLDWVVFAERPYFKQVVQIVAHDLHINIAVIPNWEWLHPRLDWIKHVDLMLCPNAHSYKTILDWKQRYGYGWDARHVSWPVDTERFAFRPRRRCERFVFVNGGGGGRGRLRDGSTTAYRRKGLELMVEAATIAPHLPFLVYSQQPDIPSLPANMKLRRTPSDNRRLYRHGDVCVQPSHFEGLGLQLLECQAAGMPLVTTDAPPMNEYHPWATIPVSGTEIIHYGEGQPIAAQLMKPESVVSVLNRLLHADLTEASLRARSDIEAAHSWRQGAALIRESLVVS
jgi:glycosyltransferase involved in cell wall biosynthesis